MKVKDWFLLINANAAGGKALRKKETVLSLLQSAGLPAQHAVSTSRDEGIRLIHEKVKEGFRHFIALGGDGTINSLVNALFTQAHVAPESLTMGLIPVGTGNDWIKTHGIPKSIAASIGIIKKGRTVHHDVGLIRKETDGKHELRYFINVAGAAFQGFVAERIEGNLQWLKVGPPAFYLALVEALFRYRATTVQFTADGAHHEEKIFNLSIGIGRYAGGGMKVTPSAVTDDGLLDITVAADLKKREVIANLPGLFSGKFVAHPKIRQWQATRLTVFSSPPVPIETDGEVFGYGNFEAEIIPQAIRVMAP